MGNKRIDPERKKFLEMGFKTVVQENNRDKFIMQLNAMHGFSSKNKDKRNTNFFKEQKKLFMR